MDALKTDSRELSAKEAAARLAQQPELCLIDVREDFEREICSLPGSQQLTEALAETMLRDWPRERQILFICHHGFRSRAVMEYFLQQGFAQVYNLTGGIDAWARDIDPSLARY